MERDQNHVNFTAVDMLRIAERVNQGVADFYVQAVGSTTDDGLSQLCHEFADHHQRQALRWAQHWHALVPLYTQAAGTGLDRLLTPEAMVGLTWLGALKRKNKPMAAVVSEASLLRDAWRRAQDLITFYEGLKAFTRDRSSREILDLVLKAQTGQQWQLESRLRACTALTPTSSSSN